MQKQKKHSPNKKPSFAPKAPVKKKALSSSRLQYLFIGIISFLIYSNTLFFKYALDDGLFITDNKLTKKGFSGIKELFTKDAFYGVYGNDVKIMLPGGRYRPISQVMFAVEYQLFGFAPGLGHLLNILLYTLLCLMLLSVLKTVFEKYESKTWYLSLPFVATLLFACHPLHTEVVANIKGRDEILCLLFSLVTLLSSIKYVQGNKIKWLIVSFVTFLFALLSKENAITFVAIIPLTIFFVYREKLKKYIILLTPLLGAVFIYFLMRFNALGFGSVTDESKELMNNPFLSVGLAERIATILFTWGRYLLLLVFPHPLTHDYYPKQIPIVGFGNVQVWITILVYLALSIYSLIRIRKRDVFAYAILIFLITFSISSNLVFNIGTFMNERFMYTPLLGFAIVCAYLIYKYLDNKKWRTTGSVLLIIFVSLYALKTFSRNFAWKDSYTLFTTDVKTSTNSAKVNCGAAEVMIKGIKDNAPDSVKSNVYKQALVYLDRSVSIYPGFSGAWIYRGYAQLQLKEYKNSQLSLIEVLKKENNSNDAKNYLNNAALECYKLGNYKQAEDNFKTLIQYVPDNTEYVYTLAELYANTNKVDSSVIILNQLLEKKPQYDKAYNKLGEIYGRVYNNFSKSFEYLNKAYAINPKNLETLRNLGTAYGIQRNYENSLRYLLEAEKVKPDDKDILNKLAVTYKNMGNLTLANEYILKAGK
ncbi:MAG: tetratricopeptide repeat protein [Bacteroidota bacterium]